MSDKSDVWQGTLALMVLKTLEAMGPLHGYGIARRIEQTSGERLSIQYGTIYPALLKLEHLAGAHHVDGADLGNHVGGDDADRLVQALLARAVARHQVA